MQRMREIWWNPWVATLSRLILAGVLLYAGGIKITQPDGARQAILAYRLFPVEWADLLGWALPIGEIGLGLLLLVGIWVRTSAILTGLLMVGFVAGIISVWVRGYSIDCGCFGAGGDVDPAGRDLRYTTTIARDLLFVLLSVRLVLRPSSRLSLERV